MEHLLQRRKVWHEEKEEQSKYKGRQVESRQITARNCLISMEPPAAFLDPLIPAVAPSLFRQAEQQIYLDGGVGDLVEVQKPREGHINPACIVVQKKREKKAGHENKDDG